MPDTMTERYHDPEKSGHLGGSGIDLLRGHYAPDESFYQNVETLPLDTVPSAQFAMDAIKRELETSSIGSENKSLRRLRALLLPGRSHEDAADTGTQGSGNDRFRLAKDDREILKSIRPDKKEEFVKDLTEFRSLMHELLYDPSCNSDEIASRVIALRKKLFLGRDWTKGRVKDLDRDQGDAAAKERESDQIWIKFLDRVFNSFFMDISAKLGYISSHPLFAAAEHAEQRGDKALAIRELQKLLKETRLGEPEYPGVKSPNAITKDGKMEVPEINIHGDISSRLLDITHIKSAKPGYIIADVRLRGEKFTDSGYGSEGDDSAGEQDGESDHNPYIPHVSGSDYNPYVPHSNVSIHDFPHDDESGHVAKKEGSVLSRNAAEKEGSILSRNAAEKTEKEGSILSGNATEKEGPIPGGHVAEGEGPILDGQDAESAHVGTDRDSREDSSSIDSDSDGRSVDSDASREHAVKYYPVNIYDIEKPDPMRKAYASKEAAKKGKEDSSEYHIELKAREDKYDRREESAKNKAIRMYLAKEAYERIRQVAGGDSFDGKELIYDNRPITSKDISKLANSISEINDIMDKFHSDHYYNRKVDQLIGEVRDIEITENNDALTKNQLQRLNRIFLLEARRIEKDLEESIKRFAALRVGEDVSVTRLVVMARAADALERRAARGLREADRAYADFLRSEQEDRWDRPMVDGEREKLSNERYKRLEYFKSYSKAAKTAWNELAERRNLTLAEAKGEYLEKFYVYAARGDDKVEIYHHQGESGSGIKLKIADIDFDRCKKNEKDQFTLYFKNNPDPIVIPWVDDLFELLRTDARDIGAARVRHTEAQIKNLLELLKDDKKLDFAKEDAVRIAFANVRMGEQRLLKTMQALLGLEAPQFDQTLLHQQIKMTELEIMSADEILEEHSRSLLHGTFTATTRRREELMQGMKSWVSQAMEEGQSAVGDARQGIERVAQYEHPLRRDNPGFTGLAYDIHARAGKLSQVEVSSADRPGTQSLTEYLSAELKKATPEVRAEIIKGSLFEAYFKYPNSPSARRKAMYNALRQYDIEPELARPIIVSLEREMYDSLRNWEGRPISSDGPGNNVRKSLSAIPSLRQRNEMINEAAAAYFRKDFATKEERGNAMAEAFSRQKEDDQEAHTLDVATASRLAASLEAELARVDNRFLSQVNSAGNTVMDYLRRHRWTDATFERKARAIIRSAAEAREKTEGVQFLEFQHVAKRFFETVDDRTLERVQKISSAIRDEGIEGIRSDRIAHRIDIQISSWLEARLPSNSLTGDTTFNGTVEGFLREKGISESRLAKMVRASIEAYSRLAPSISEGEEAAIEAFHMHANGKITPHEAKVLVDGLLQGHEKIRNGLWDVTEAMFAHLYCYDPSKRVYISERTEQLSSLTGTSSLADSSSFTSSEETSEGLKEGYEREKREIYNRLTLKDDGPLVNRHVEDWLTKETGAQYDYSDPLNTLWKNRQTFETIYSKYIEKDNFKEDYNLEFLTKRLSPLDEEVLDDHSYDHLNQEEKDLLRGTIRFQNQWIHNLKSAVDRYTRDEENKSEKLWDDVAVTLQHSRHQMLTMEYDRQIVLNSLEAYTPENPEQGKEMLKHSVPEEVGKPLQESFEVYREMTQSLKTLRKGINEELNTLINDKEVKITPLELMEKLNLWAKEAASVNSRKEAVELALAGRLDEAFKSSFAVNRREVALLASHEAMVKQLLEQIKDIKKSDLEFEHKQESLKLAAKQAWKHMKSMIIIVGIMNGNQSALLMTNGFDQFSASVIRNATR